MDYLKDGASLKKLERIFSNSHQRSSFIADYTFFGTDGNKQFYIDFIDTYIDKSRSSRQEDAIELSIASNIFKPQYIDAISKIITHRRSDFMKLMALDWLFNFYDELPEHEFLMLNNKILSQVNNSSVLKMQGMLNLIIKTKKASLIEKLIDVLKQADDHLTFYRLSNVMKDQAWAKHYFANHLVTLIDIISSTKALTETQKKEIISAMSVAD